jgi:hypothetical protein
MTNEIPAHILVKDPLYIYYYLQEPKDSNNVFERTAELVSDEKSHNTIATIRCSTIKRSVLNNNTIIRGSYDSYIDTYDNSIHKVSLISSKTLAIESKDNSSTHLELAIVNWLLQDDSYKLQLDAIVKDASYYNPDAGPSEQTVYFEPIPDIEQYITNKLNKVQAYIDNPNTIEECKDLRWYKNKQGITKKVACELCQYNSVCKFYNKSKSISNRKAKSNIANRLKNLKNL